MPAKKIAITHPEMGVYLGCCMGLGFWTLLDSAAQPAAVVFDSIEQAHEHIETWDEGNDPSAYGFREVAADGHYATIPSLIAAGLAPLLGNMAADALKYADATGSA